MEWAEGESILRIQMNLHLIQTGAPSGGRTHTGRILSPLPLPLGYRGISNY